MLFFINKEVFIRDEMKFINFLWVKLVDNLKFYSKVVWYVVI